MLLLAGSHETYLTGKGAFQEMDAVSLLSGSTKFAARVQDLSVAPGMIRDAYRVSFFGRPGPAFLDLPADLLTATLKDNPRLSPLQALPSPPKPSATPETIAKVANLLRSSQNPLVVIGKGAAYCRAENVIRSFIDSTRLPFLPTPMGKGVVPDSHPCNVAAARSTALKEADVVLVLGARLNWILHYGSPPKWNASVQIVQVDICAEEIGSNGGNPLLGLVGDIISVVAQLAKELVGWRYCNNEFISKLDRAKDMNSQKAAAAYFDSSIPMSYRVAFDAIKKTLDRISPARDGQYTIVSEGANTMDISRTVFSLEHPRLRLDAGTNATMGIGLSFAIAAYMTYNVTCEGLSGPSQKKKIIAVEGDSGFGFSAMEVETMARFKMDILIFVINNSGIYHGDATSSEDWYKRQSTTVGTKEERGARLRSTSLLWETGYDKIAEACGGRGFLVRTPEELKTATEIGYSANVPCVVNVIIKAGEPPKKASQPCKQCESCANLVSTCSNLHGKFILGVQQQCFSMRGEHRPTATMAALIKSSCMEGPMPLNFEAIL